MKNQIILWFSSIIIVFLMGYVKNVTSKDYPITGTFGIEGKKVSYKLDKVSFDKTSYKNIIISDIEGVNGKIFWLKNNVQFENEFKEIDRGLECEIPKLKPGQQIKYKVILTYLNKQFIIPEKDFITLTFWGYIPSTILILNFIFLYGGLLMSIRSLLELFNKNINLKKFSVITCVLFIAMVMIISPLKNSYKLGAINHFVPKLTEVIQPVLILILFVWIVGPILIFYKKYAAPVMILITSVTVLLFFFL
jgi:hypothetical protein